MDLFILFVFIITIYIIISNNTEEYHALETMSREIFKNLQKDVEKIWHTSMDDYQAQQVMSWIIQYIKKVNMRKLCI